MRNRFGKSLFSLVVTAVSLMPLARAQDRALTGTKALTIPAVLVIQMPEPSSPAMLAIDLLSVGGLIYVVRRRVARKNR
jgi:hypothetical protein